MANATMQYLADQVLNWVKGTSFAAAPSNLYIALLTTNPTTNTGTSQVECSDSGYARIAIASSGWSAVSQNADTIHDQISNSAAVTFGAAVASYTVTGIAVYDASTSGHELWAQPVTSQAVAIGNQYQLAAGACVIEI